MEIHVVTHVIVKLGGHNKVVQCKWNALCILTYQNSLSLIFFPHPKVVSKGPLPPPTTTMYSLCCLVLSWRVVCSLVLSRYLLWREGGHQTLADQLVYQPCRVNSRRQYSALVDSERLVNNLLSELLMPLLSCLILSCLILSCTITVTLPNPNPKPYRNPDPNPNPSAFGYLISSIGWLVYGIKNSQAVVFYTVY